MTFEINPRLDSGLAQEVIKAIDDGHAAKSMRTDIDNAATVAQIAGSTWVRLRLDVESFVDLAGQLYDLMTANAEAEMAQGRDPWALAGYNLPVETGTKIQIDPKYSFETWNRVTSVLTANGSKMMHPQRSVDEVATLLSVAARTWVLCRFNRTSLTEVARRVYMQSAEDERAAPTSPQPKVPKEKA